MTECLVETADCIRQLYTDFGLRPYRVKLVWIGWTADEDDDGMIQGDEVCLDDDMVGVGRSILLTEMEILPTPRVSELTGIAKDQDAVGLTERGGITVDQISSRFTEDILMGLLFEYRDESRPDTLKPGIEFFWEVQNHTPARFVTPGYEGCDRLTDRRQPRRRFHVSSTPHLSADGFQWTVSLVRADGERDRDGLVEAVDGGPFDDGS